MLLFNPLQKAFAIDISDLRLRLIQLQKRTRGIKLRCYNELVVPEGYIVEGEIKQPDKVVDLISKLVSTTKGGKVLSKYVVASLPERRTYFKVFSIPLVTDKEISGTIKWGIEQNIPVTMEEVSYDWQILSENKKTNQAKVTVAVIPKSITESYLELLRKAKLIPVVLETESSSIARAIVTEEDKNSGIILVDLGASRTSLILIDSGAIYYSSTIDLSGHEMTQSISRALKLSPDQAEKAKHICGLDEKKGRGAIRKTILPLFNLLDKKVDEIIRFYESSMNKKNPLKIVLCGGVSQMIGLQAYLSEILPAPVSIGDPLAYLPSMKEQKLLPSQRILPYTTALGLALRPVLLPDKMFQ
ncbi:type IV pilus assembly protein PilM [Patescibacteria group bacterium]